MASSRSEGHENSPYKRGINAQTAASDPSEAPEPAERSWPMNAFGLRSGHTASNPSPRSTGLRQERGHSFARIQPMSRHSGTSVTVFFNGLFTTVIGIATLGASITFSYVISNNPPPPHSRTFDQAQVQLFLSISWLLFLLALAFASVGNTLLTFFKEHWKSDWDCRNGDESRIAVQVYAAFAGGLLGTLTITAFVFLCLVVIAYSPVIGWLALGFTAAFGLAIEGSVLYQAPWPWRRETVLPPVKTPTGMSGANGDGGGNA